jgi:hypothetical protein
VNTRWTGAASGAVLYFDVVFVQQVVAVLPAMRQKKRRQWTMCEDSAETWILELAMDWSKPQQEAQEKKG